jgi:hypothetical protein
MPKDREPLKPGSAAKPHRLGDPDRPRPQRLGRAQATDDALVISSEARPPQHFNVWRNIDDTNQR